MFGLDDFGLLVFATSGEEDFKVYTWKDKCKEPDFYDWSNKGNARSESERPSTDCWK
ncbi:unnamed protein product [marine sediment metagenome]|uniref:Uncharacterized protein n=1 Tax=marine sediment metagenome TaxID=412755 RepID=X0S7C4_9ZZZZ